MNKNVMTNIALTAGLVIFTFIVFKLQAGAFTIVMAIFASVVFALILQSPDEKEKN